MTIETVTVPDFGDVQEIVVVEVYVKVGDSIEFDQSLIALESEKAVMDIPSPIAGIVDEIFVQEDDRVKSGAPILSLKVGHPKAEQDADALVGGSQGEEQEKPETIVQTVLENEAAQNSHATPSVRAFAREMEVDLTSITGTGPKGRITKEDVHTFLADFKARAQTVSTASGTKATAQVTAQPVAGESSGEDFSRFGPIEIAPLSRIQKISGAHILKSWQEIPQVTQFDEADIHELESFRQGLREQSAGQKNYSQLVFVMKAVAASLKAFPLFNSSLQAAGESVVLKNYCHIGIAVDTAKGLVVPVIRDVDKKGVSEIASELSQLSQQAREGKLSIDQLQGASFTISSLGGIGGTGFTPIVNSPQVAILGLSRNYLRAVWDKELQGFTPRLTLPFSVSYDHRVIDGADGARFCRALAGYLEDLRMILL